jgi:hypothetical protein
MKKTLIFLLSLSVLVAAGCAMFKHDVECPANAYCEAIDFGGVQLTACLSMSEMVKLKAIAAERKASWERTNESTDAGSENSTSPTVF